MGDMKISLQIRRIRKERGLSLDQLGEMIGMSGGYLSELERGIKNINSRRLNQLAEALRCSPSELLGEGADDSYKEFIRDFSSLTPENQASISHLISALLKDHKSQD